MRLDQSDQSGQSDQSDHKNHARILQRQREKRRCSEKTARINMPQNKPNFLIIMTDQMRADHMGCAGNPVIRTPNLDRLAAEGVNFSRAYVNCPLCMPGRATIFTGLTPRGHRVRTNGIQLGTIFPTMPQALAEAGYRTASIGKIHLRNYGYSAKNVEQAPPAEFSEMIQLWKSGKITRIPTPYYGLQHVEATLGHSTGVHGDYALWLQQEHPEQWERLKQGAIKWPTGAEQSGTYPIEEQFHHTAYVADHTIEYLNNCTPDSPFFLMCSFPDPHHAYVPPKPWDTMYSPDEVVPPVARAGELDDLAPFFSEAYSKGIKLSGRFAPTNMSDGHRRDILALTYGQVSLIDKQVGRVLDQLEASGLADNTIVVFISDHGDMMGDHGLANKGPFHFEGLLRVPMIWRWPGRFGSQRTPALASLLDLPPTILDIAGVPIPTGPASDEAPMQPPAWPGRSLMPVLNGQAKKIQDSVVIENDEDYLGLRLRTLVTPDYKITTYTGHHGPEPYGEMFDFRDDPNELHNLWARTDCQTLKRDLIVQLHYRLTETDIAVPRRQAHA